MASSSSSSSFSILSICFIALLLLISSYETSASGDADLFLGLIPIKSGCGNIGECLSEEEDEFGLDSEINRRILATTNYISYGALQRNSVPCSRRGASYYNCRSGAQANPYSRGCSAITRCRS
ncbi:protein RALF-like 33 [Impatiens glandulifera]|uniref:protein RALF-like 33 n=1 Tax=Impatiens glandulifera TaxID=253017 RepID=UPI001FB0BFE2|nr:protein RALF-like 33 [Impatiens glandulifera]